MQNSTNRLLVTSSLSAGILALVDVLPHLGRHAQTNPLTSSGLLTAVALTAASGFLLGYERKASSSRGLSLPTSGLTAEPVWSLIPPKKLDVSFEDVAGIDDIRGQLDEMVDVLENPTKYKRLGAKPRRGVILSGPPGVGKTLLARAIAAQTSCPFINVSSSSFCEMFVGVGPARMRSLKAFAAKHAPCVVFMDEIEALCGKRGRSVNSDERDATLNELLMTMDGLEELKGVFFIGATNRAEMLDPAVLRPSRFGAPLEIRLPVRHEREAIIRATVGRRRIPLNTDVDIPALAEETTGFTGDDLASMLNRAALLAAKNEASTVQMSDILTAKDALVAGEVRQGILRHMTSGDILRTAVHEAGHALAALCVPNGPRVDKVTITPRGKSLGMVLTTPRTESVALTEAECEDFLIIAMAGYVAETLTGERGVSSGAEEDLKAATRRARLMVTRWGMGAKVGLISIPTDECLNPIGVSNTLMSHIEGDVRRLLENARANAEVLIKTHQVALRQLTLALIEHETLTGQEVQDLVGSNLHALHKERTPPLELN